LGQAHPDRARDYGLAAIDRSLVGITKTTCLHLCFGYAFAAARAGIQKPSGYSFLPELDLSLLDGLPSKTVVLGVLDLGDPAAESPGTVARRIEAALARRPASGLVAAPDCGMKHLPRATAFAKLRSLAEGARLAGGD